MFFFYMKLCNRVFQQAGWFVEPGGNTRDYRQTMSRRINRWCLYGAVKEN